MGCMTIVTTTLNISLASSLRRFCPDWEQLRVVPHQFDGGEHDIVFILKRHGCIFADSPSPRQFCCQFERVWKIRREIPSHSQAISCQIEAEWATLAKCKQGRECCKTKWATQTTFHASKECIVLNIQSALYPPIIGMTFPSRPTKMLHGGWVSWSKTTFL